MVAAARRCAWRIPTGCTTGSPSPDPRRRSRRSRPRRPGAGIIPWQLDPARIAEDVFLRLVAPPPPQQRSLSLAGARILAGQLRDAAARRHDLALARVGHSRACPFDLHALLPVPGDILRRGPDDPAALAWLWEHWGTTDALRHVTAERAAGRGPAPPDRRAGGGDHHHLLVGRLVALARAGGDRGAVSGAALRPAAQL